MKISMIRLSSIIALFFLSLIFAQDDFGLEDLNPNSEFYGQIIGPNTFLGGISIIYFGHEY